MNHLSDDGLDPYAKDSIDPALAKKKVRHFTALIGLLVAGLISTTIAANISLSGGRVEFGQGVFLIRACDQWVAVRLNSNGTNLSGIDLIGLDAKRCAGSQFTIRAFTTGSTTPLNIFTGTIANGSTGAVDVIYLKVNPTVPSSFACTNAYNTYAEKSVSLVNMATTNVAYADAFHRLTYETLTATYMVVFETPTATVASVDSVTLESGNIDSSSPSYTEGSCNDGSSASLAAASGFALKTNYPALPSGTYWIKSALMPNALQMYVDMTIEGGGYDYYFATTGPSVNLVTQVNAGTSLGLDLVMPRSKLHWQSMYNTVNTQRPNPGISISSYFMTTYGIYRNTVKGSGGNYTQVIMNSANATEWRVKDGGRWWLRDTIYSEPNGDYTLNGLLSMRDNTTFQNLENLTFNDGGAQVTGNYYLVSTNAKP